MSNEQIPFPKQGEGLTIDDVAPAVLPGEDVSIGQVRKKGTHTRETRRMSHPRHRSLDMCDKPFAVMGILNVTDDSFYDGGRHAGVDAAALRARAMIADGADIIDIGGESTRPGAHPVTEELECERCIPVIKKIRDESDIPISIDTTKSVVAAEALRAGATWINDISAGRFDAGMPLRAAAAACPVVLMHSRGTPRDMQDNPRYENVVVEVHDELLAAVGRFVAAGVSPGNVVLDPGIGFGKRFEDNVTLIAHIGECVSWGYPLLIGTSRKSFIGHITGRRSEDRLAGTLASVGVAFAGGAKMFRVHDVRETVDFLSVLAVLNHD
jgi:dihydropteroate synthase